MYITLCITVLQHSMSSSWFECVLLSALYALEASRRPMFKSPSLGPRWFSSNLKQMRLRPPGERVGECFVSGKAGTDRTEETSPRVFEREREREETIGSPSKLHSSCCCVVFIVEQRVRRCFVLQVFAGPLVLEYGVRAPLLLFNSYYYFMLKTCFQLAQGQAKYQRFPPLSFPCCHTLDSGVTLRTVTCV